MLNLETVTFTWLSEVPKQLRALITFNINLRDTALPTQLYHLSVYAFSPLEGSLILNLQIVFKFVSYAQFIFSAINSVSLSEGQIIRLLFWVHFEIGRESSYAATCIT